MPFQEHSQLLKLPAASEHFVASTMEGRHNPDLNDDSSNSPTTGLKHVLADPTETRNIKVENCIGFARVPFALAGPLTILGDNQKATIFAPLATTEATLVASAARGCKLLQRCGGVRSAALSENMHRAPVFRFATVDDAVAFYKLVPSLVARFKTDAEKTSRHARLFRVTPHIIGSAVHVKFEYKCGDAAGQNMATIATQAACRASLSSPTARECQISGFQIEGQLSSDKKASWRNALDGRGVQVVAWAAIQADACKAVLGVTTAQLYRTLMTGEHGSIRSGSFGSNINTANILAAMFTACGQDVGSVFEAGFSHLTPEYDDNTKELTLSLYFPCMVVGTVGGGTGYSTQQEALKLIKCFGNGRKWALAETIASFALALDISTVSAVANDTFSDSHKRLARL